MKYNNKQRNKEYKALLKMGYTEKDLSLLKSSIGKRVYITVTAGRTKEGMASCAFQNIV